MPAPSPWIPYQTRPPGTSTNPSRTATSELEVVRVLREDLVPVLGDENDVLDPHPAEVGEVEARLDRDDVADDERLAAVVERGRLVELETEAVAEVVDEALLEHLVLRRVEPRRVTPVPQVLGGDPVQLAAGHARPDRLGRAPLRL